MDATTFTISTGGVIESNFNIDQWKMIREVGSFLWESLIADGNRKNTLPVFIVFLMIFLFKIWMVRKDRKIRDEQLRSREKEKAQIWKNEMDNK